MNVEEMFNDNLIMAIEDNLGKDADTLEIAKYWTINQITNSVCMYADRIRQSRIEATNKLHFG